VDFLAPRIVVTSSVSYLGIPVKYFPDDLEVIKPVQFAALFTDLVKHTRFALKQLDIND
jgi:hypothetical protein